MGAGGPSCTERGTDTGVVDCGAFSANAEVVRAAGSEAGDTSIGSNTVGGWTSPAGGPPSKDKTAGASRTKRRAPRPSRVDITAAWSLMQESVADSNSSCTCCITSAPTKGSPYRDQKSAKDPSRTKAMVGGIDASSTILRVGMMVEPNALVRVAGSIASMWVVMSSGTL